MGRGEDTDLSQDFEELQAMGFMFGSMLAFTNVPRNLMIISILISIAGISAISKPLLEVDNSDWEPINATVGSTQVEDAHCTDWLTFFQDDCRFDGYFPSVSFYWDIEGERYYSLDYMTYPPNLSTHNQAQRWMEERGMVPGGNITGYVNPDDPSEAVIVRQSWTDLLVDTGDVLFTICCSLCNVLPLLILVTTRRFEWAIPKERRKRYKLEYKGKTADGGYTWDTPQEAKELQVEARRIRLKSMSSSLSDEQFEELTSISEYMDSEAKPLEGGGRTFTVLLSDGQEMSFEASSEGGLFSTLSNIDDDSFVLYLDESKAEGRLLEFTYLEEGPQEDRVRVREYVGQELISDETFNIETDMSGMMDIITQARRNSEKTDEKWWS